MVDPGKNIGSTQIAVCLWLLAKNKNADAKRGFRDRFEVENQ
jgi:type I restriction enzyme M protein